MFKMLFVLLRRVVKLLLTHWLLTRCLPSQKFPNMAQTTSQAHRPNFSKAAQIHPNITHKTTPKSDIRFTLRLRSMIRNVQISTTVRKCDRSVKGK